MKKSTITVNTYEEAVEALRNADENTIVLDPDGSELFVGDYGPMYSDGASASAYGPLSEEG